MAAVIRNVLLKLLSKVFHHYVGHLWWNGVNFLTNSILKCFEGLRLEGCAEVFGEGRGGYSLPNTENFACSQYRTDGNAPHRCTTKQLWEGRVEEYPQIKFSGFPSLLHLITVQPSFCTGAF